jgi:hypothetical protein
MLKVDEFWLREAEKLYPGIRRSIAYYEGLDLPPCPTCGAVDTASVSAGIVGRSIHVAAATTKMRLLPDGHSELYYCNACGRYFSEPGYTPDDADFLPLGLLDPRTATDEDLEAFCAAVRAQGARPQPPRLGEPTRHQSACGAAPCPTCEDAHKPDNTPSTSPACPVR